MFSGGFLIMVFGLLRCILILKVIFPHSFIYPFMKQYFQPLDADLFPLVWRQWR